MLEEKDLAKLVSRCRAVPLTRNEYVATDFVVALLETVMDYQNATTTVQRAGKHFEDNRWDEIRTLDDLERVLERFPADRDGNDALAQYLWGYHHWRRAQELRGLVGYFRERNVTDLAALRAWAVASTSEDFVGHIKGLGNAVYHGLVMRLGDRKSTRLNSSHSSISYAVFCLKKKKKKKNDNVYKVTRV